MKICDKFEIQKKHIFDKAMNKVVKRKEFLKIFETINSKGKNVYAINRIQELSSDIIGISMRLAELDFIKYVKVTDEIISASSELKVIKTKIPNTTMNHPTAIGIEIIYHLKYKILDFSEINSPIKGNGSKMISVVLKDLPKNWKLSVVMDWSDGFWDKMAERYNDREWLI